MLKKLALLLSLLGALGTSHAQTLTIGCDWPGWVAWEVGIEKGWFEEANVDVVFEWFDYVASMRCVRCRTARCRMYDEWRRSCHRRDCSALGNGTDQ